MIVAGLLGMGVIVLVILVALVLRQNGMLFSLPVTPTSSPVVIAPTILVPTVTCDSQTFTLGATTFQIQNLALAPDGSLIAPPAVSGVAYWLETTEGNYLVVLSPTPENIALQTTLTAESAAKVTWADCSSMTFSLSAPEPNHANISTLPGQLTSGLAIFFQTDETGNGLVVRGELTEMTLP